MDKGMDITTIRALLAYHAAAYGDPRKLGNASQAALRSRHPQAALSLLKQKTSLKPDFAAADQALGWLECNDCAICFVSDSRYPALLREISDPPLLLFVRGLIDPLNSPQLAIVGSRRASTFGRNFAKRLAASLVELKATVTSGLALGIDAAAHRGALAAAGHTIAVLGCGVDRIYPARHHELAHEITQHGALISEFPLKTPPRPHHFPQRNRLIAGMSLGTVVVEAAQRSGSISTAMHALNAGREVFAVPGSVASPLSQGCHHLLREGACLLESVNDIERELAPYLTRSEVPELGPRTPAETPAAANPEQQKLLAALGYAPHSVDELVVASGLTVSEVSSMLAALELGGEVEIRANGTYVRCR